MISGTRELLQMNWTIIDFGYRTTMAMKGEIHINKDTWRRSLCPGKFIKESTMMDEKKQATIENLELGSRIAVYFPYEKEYYYGTLTKKRDVSAQMNGPHRIKYDDGDKEWTDLRKRKFKLITKKADP